MKTDRRRTFWRVGRTAFVARTAMLCAALVVGGCAQYEEYEYRPDYELKPGAGLFTGKGGAWVVVGDDQSETGDDGESSTQEKTRRDEPKSNRPLKIRGRRQR